MCVGSSPPPATITQPNYAYESAMQNIQLDALRYLGSDPQNLIGRQADLNQQMLDEGRRLLELRDLRVAAANETAANVERLTALIGPPTPDEGAQYVAIGSQRRDYERAKGTRRLTIGLDAPRDTRLRI